MFIPLYSNRVEMCGTGRFALNELILMVNNSKLK